MLAVTALASAASLAMLIPPPVPPDPQALAAAEAMLEHHPPAPEIIDAAIERTLEGIANGAVSQAYRGEFGGLRWLEYRQRILSNIRPMVAPHRDEMVARARPCIASWYARNMSAADIEAVDEFLATPAGRSFWKLVGPSGAVWSSCIYDGVSRRIDIDGALVASGLPRLDQPPLNR